MVEGKYVRGPRVRQAADGAGSRVVACRSELSGGGGSRVARAPWVGTSRPQKVEALCTEACSGP